MSTDFDPEKFRERRIRLNIPLSSLAEYMGCSAGLLGYWENGKYAKKEQLRYYDMVLTQIEEGKLQLKQFTKKPPKSGKPEVSMAAAQATMLLRTFLEIKVEDAADAVGLDTETLSFMELGKKIMSFKQLTALLQYYAMRVESMSGEATGQVSFWSGIE